VTPPARKLLGHRAAVGYDVSSHPAYNDPGEEEEEILPSHAEDDLNYTMFDLNVDSIDVTLSLRRWFDGKGLVEDAVVKGVRGVIGRKHNTGNNRSVDMPLQIVVLFVGIQKIPLTQRPSAIPLVRETSSCNHFNSRTSSSPFISRGNSGRILRLSFALTSGH